MHIEPRCYRTDKELAQKSKEQEVEIEEDEAVVEIY